MTACLDETQSLAFTSGEMGGKEREAVEAHIDDCDTCRQVVSAIVRNDTASDWLPGMRVGRYVVRAKIGRGGMGAVWRAEDVELGRPVALKRLHAGAEQADRARLLREARAAAQLQHPNVVAVYEVGEATPTISVPGGTPFLAMELVDGSTLGTWLKTPRELRAITNVLAQAGRGLAAAHACGLAHRDFKPDNVLVDRSGRARVVDFGLAKPEGARASTIRRPSGSSGAPEVRLTETGAISGTPAYLAPEILDGALPDARSDQYAFAITCFEALHGEHPFAGGTAEVMWTEMAAGRIRESSGGVPARLDRAVRRGLAVDPKERWPNVAALVEALERQQRRRWPWLAGAAALVAINAFAFAMSRTPAEETCESGASLVERVWNADVRDAQARRFAEAAPQRTGAIASAGRLTDDWADAWKLGHDAACHATSDHRQLRMACLDRELDELRAQLAVWSAPTANAVDGLLAAAAALPRPENCANAMPPTEHVHASRELIARIDAFAALQRADRHREALPLVPSLLADAEASGDPLALARVLMVAGVVEKYVGDPDKARTYDARAAREAARAGDDSLTLHALIEEATVATVSGHPRDSLGTLDAAEALEERGKLGLGARIHVTRADALGALGRMPEAIAAYHLAIDELEPKAARDRGARLDLAAALGALGSTLSRQGKIDEALVELDRCHDIELAELGPDDPEAARTVHDIANQEVELGHLDKAVELYQESRAVFLKAYGPKHELVAASDMVLANVERERGHWHEAMRMYQQLLGELPDNSVMIANVEFAIGQTARELDDTDGASKHIGNAIERFEQAGITGVDLADARSTLALVWLDAKRLDRARHEAELSLVEYDRAGAAAGTRINAWLVMAESEHHVGRNASAIEYERKVIAALGKNERADNVAVRKQAEAMIAEWSK